MSRSALPPRLWDIFCRVVDNFGDIGVCWRLARQLTNELDLEIRLWIDDLTSLAPLCPGVDASLATQQVEGVTINQWTQPFPDVVPADIVIEAFACELPPNYLQAMAAVQPMPGWINLEYLSAEPWVESCHRVASPHPNLPLIKYFYFPGFTEKTGGLLCESGLLADRAAAQATQVTKAALEVSLFCYDTAPAKALIDAWAAHPSPIHCHVAAGKPTAMLEQIFACRGPWHRGNLTLEPLPFLPQADYDRLLWSCDLNLVRGEDSFVRAQWAARPFLWQVYPQTDDTHLDKLEAFLRLYTQGMPKHLCEATHALFDAWNGKPEQLAEAWPRFAAALPELRAFTQQWGATLSSHGNLAENLVKFCTYEI